jgi:hypothetical protein
MKRAANFFTIRFTAILGLQDHTYYPKKLNDDRVMELNRMRFMYENDEYKLSKVEGFKHFFFAPSAFAEDFVSKGG